jgi:hypothetical protein
MSCVKMETKVVHFSVDPEGVVELARDRYWFEDAKTSGVNILRSFICIEPYQITKILEGDATMVETQNGIYYQEKTDESFKRQLKSHLDYQHRKLQEEAEDYIFLGGVKVHKDLVEEYCGHVVKRLRETMRNTAHGIMFDTKDIDEILGLETRRQELHDAILNDAGFDRHESTDEARTFCRVLDEYVDAKAGTLFNEPLEEMKSDEIENKRKQSEANIEYMNRLMRVQEVVDKVYNT